MSTKSTLWYDGEYHLYQEGFDHEHVYLDIQSSHFAELTLKLPLPVWKELRKHTIQPDEEYLDLSDEQLRAEAVTAVDKHRKWLEENNDSRLASLFGFFCSVRPKAR